MFAFRSPILALAGLFVLCQSQSAQAQLKLSDQGNVTVGTLTSGTSEKMQVKCNERAQCTRAALSGLFNDLDYNGTQHMAGVYGNSAHGPGGVRGYGGNFAGGQYGVYAIGTTLNASGVYGTGRVGVVGKTLYPDGLGVRGEGQTGVVGSVGALTQQQLSSLPSAGVYGKGSTGIYGTGTGGGESIGVYGTGAVGVKGKSLGPSIGVGVEGSGNIGVKGSSSGEGAGVSGISTSGGVGVKGESSTQGGDGVGVSGSGTTGVEGGEHCRSRRRRQR